MRGKTLIERENIPQTAIISDQQKKLSYKQELERQMEEKKVREKAEKEKRKMEEKLEEERVRKELEEKRIKYESDKLAREKERKEKEDLERMQLEEKIRQDKIREAEKRKNVRSNSRGNTPQDPISIQTPNTYKLVPFSEISPKQKIEQTPPQDKPEFELDNIQDMIRTNQDWINTKLSKDYVLYKRREEGGTPEEDKSRSKYQSVPARQTSQPKEDKLERPIKQEQVGVKQPAQADHFKNELMNQLENAKREAKEAMERRDKAEKKLFSLKEEYYTKLEESKTSKAQLEAALMRTATPTSNSRPTSTENSRRNHQQPTAIHLYNRGGEVNLDSYIKSIALECQTHFVSVENMQGSELDRIAEESFIKAYKSVSNSRGSASVGGMNGVRISKAEEERVFEDIDKIMKEFELKNKKTIV